MECVRGVYVCVSLCVYNILDVTIIRGKDTAYYERIFFLAQELNHLGYINAMDYYTVLK